jgi:hypothetical protein
MIFPYLREPCAWPAWPHKGTLHVDVDHGVSRLRSSRETANLVMPALQTRMSSCERLDRLGDHPVHLGLLRHVACHGDGSSTNA